jgi:hypothetical protein
MSLTIDCGEGRHFPICVGTGTERYLMPQDNDEGDEFVCACGCHLTDPPGGIPGPEMVKPVPEVPEPDDNYIGGYLEGPGENVHWEDGEGQEGPISTDGVL